MEGQRQRALSLIVSSRRSRGSLILILALGSRELGLFDRARLCKYSPVIYAILLHGLKKELF